MMLLPMLTGTVATAMMFAGRQGGTYAYVVGAVFGVSSLGMLATSFGTTTGQPKKAEMMAARREYLRHLAALRRKVREHADRQRDGLHYRHPDPTTLWSAVDSFRLWERRPGDADFGVVRVGIGPQTLATPLVPPTTGPVDDLEPMTAGALRRYVDTSSAVPALPGAVSVRGFARLHIRGPEDATRALVRAMLAQLTVFHAPDDLLVAACVAPERRPEWEYLKWLPHALHPTGSDGLGPVRLIADSAPELEALLEDVIANRPRFSPGGTDPPGPHVVIVVDGGDLAGSDHRVTEGGVAGVALLGLDAPPPRVRDRASIALAVSPEGVLRSSSADEDGDVGVADGLARPGATAPARQPASLRLAAATRIGDAPLQSDTGLAELLGIVDADAFEAATGWAPRPGRNRLRVPIGIGADGHPVELDLKESAQDGMGPHGLLIGATGSGKSELLRTLVLGLAATHDSETLNFVLIDFKGGATFASMDKLPHTAAMITNLESELPLVDRMNDALEGELNRRQELLRRAGNFASLRDYEKARVGGAALAPLPILLVICDEFSEVLAKKPELIDLFVQLGRGARAGRGHGERTRRAGRGASGGGCPGASGGAAAVDPVRRPRRVARPAGHRRSARVHGRQSATARRAAGTRRARRQAVRAAPRPALVEPVRRRGARGRGRRTAERQVHATPYRPLWTVVDPHAGPGTGLLPRLRRRRPGRTARAAARRRGGGPARTPRRPPCPLR